MSKSVVIVYDNYFPTEIAEDLYQGLGKMPYSWFDKRIKYPQTDSTIQSHHIMGDGYKPSIKNDLDLSFSFLTTAGHIEECDCSYCKLNKLFTENPPKECKGRSILSDFISIYRPGDFLSQHKDNESGREWAWTYTLTKEWRPEWGGLLHIDRGKGRWESYSPVFNRLILMDVSPPRQDGDDDGLIHYVSEITREAPINRITYSGWYKLKLVNTKKP